MSLPLSRRDLLKLATAQCLVSLPTSLAHAGPLRRLHQGPAGWVSGNMTGAEALVETLIQEGTECVFGIPGAQENELWDTMKSKHLAYLLVTHEFSAAVMADGYARSTGKPGVICVVPGPGVTNSLSGIGEALLDSVPLVCIVGDVARGDKYRPFQVHGLPQAGLLRNVTKAVFEVCHTGEICQAVRQAFSLACAGEPGPVAVVVPYNLLIEAHRFHCGPLEPVGLPLDETAFQRALCLLSNRRLRVGIYAGYGCMDYGPTLVRLAETLQAPVATSMSGKGVIAENHPLAVGWGYGPQGTRTAEQVFKGVDVLLAIGVRYSEVSTGFYSQPQHAHLIHVDINADNLGRIMRTEVCVHADAGVFMEHLLEQAPLICRPADGRLVEQIRRLKNEDLRAHEQIYARCGADPMAFLLALRRCASADALVFVDVTSSQYWATEAFTCYLPRTFFNPTNNQAMGWSIGAALGAQRVHPGRQTITITGDGCFLMSAMEISTAAREHLPVKFFVLDDQTYHYMQLLQLPAYLRTTATILARLDYQALAQGFGVAYQEISATGDLEGCIRGVLCHDGPVLVRVVTDYRRRPVRWIKAVRDKFSKELTTEQKIRFLARIGSRALHPSPEND
jgi:acetolactate synthase-1/2/3 large subunit